MKELVNLFFAFARIGAFTFGGGYAMLPMLQKEIVEKKKPKKKTRNTPFKKPFSKSKKNMGRTPY